MSAQSAGMHPDEIRIVEDHEQTAHKLAVWFRYPGAWATIIAHARGGRFSRDHMWMVDTHAGAGLHCSREHPDGVRPGTPVLACYAARNVQRKNPGVKLHVRAIDIKLEYVEKLRKRVEPFTTASGPDQVDVKVFRDDFAHLVPGILAETTPGQCRSLWFIDPYGVSEIPHRGLAPLHLPRYGPELVINLDVSGLWRVSGAAEGAADPDEIRSRLDPNHVISLDRTYGGDAWKSALTGFRPRIDSFDRFAEVYADTFPNFEMRRIYRLRSSGNQVRYFVHLSHSPQAERAFEKTFEATQKVGLFAGKGLSQTQRSQMALQYFELFPGMTTSVDDLYDAGLLQDRGQIKAVCRTAADEGYGKFDEPRKTMIWFQERLATQLTLLTD